MKIRKWISPFLLLTIFSAFISESILFGHIRYAFAENNTYSEEEHIFLIETEKNIYSLSTNKLGFIGRWYPMTVNNKQCIVTNNCGSELNFRTEGTDRISIIWEPMTDTKAYYAFAIDGNDPVRKSIEDQTILLPNKSAHIIRVITDGITERIDKWETGNGFALSDVSTEFGQITNITLQKPLLMFFGDSITEGIRALGIAEADMGETNSATNAYPWFCCEELGAISYRIGYGATGILNPGSFNRAIDALEYYYSNVPSDSIQPDLIIINYGTNDEGLDRAAFIEGYSSFLCAIKGKYPGVEIAVMIPFSQAMAEEIRTVVFGQEKVFLIETSTWEDITYSDGLHPDANGAACAGRHLANEIRKLWGYGVLDSGDNH